MARAYPRMLRDYTHVPARLPRVRARTRHTYVMLAWRFHLSMDDCARVAHCVTAAACLHPACSQLPSHPCGCLAGGDTSEVLQASLTVLSCEPPAHKAQSPHYIGYGRLFRS